MSENEMKMYVITGKDLDWIKLMVKSSLISIQQNPVQKAPIIGRLERVIGVIDIILEKDD